MNWSALFLFIVAALLCWWMFRVIRTQKSSFTKANFTTTLGTLGVLAVILIAFVALCVLLVKQ